MTLQAYEGRILLPQTVFLPFRISSVSKLPYGRMKIELRVPYSENYYPKYTIESMSALPPGTHRSGNHLSASVIESGPAIGFSRLQ